MASNLVLVSKTPFLPNYIGNMQAWAPDHTQQVQSSLSEHASVINALVGAVPAQVTMTYSQLPASPNFGQMAAITDSTVNTFGAKVTVGGGTHNVFMWFDGAHWSVMGIVGT